MKIVKRKIKELIPAKYNPRQISEKELEDLKKSFENLGTLEPAVINTYKGRENIIISGHQRIKIATELGIKEYPCVEVKFPLHKEKEANIRMNKNTGTFDFNLLEQNFDISDLVDFGFDLKEFSFDENPVSGLTEDDEVPEVPEEAKSKLGELYILGEHKLLCGDCRDQENVSRLLGDELCDIFLTDPPYNVDYVGKTKKKLTIKNDKKKDEDFRNFLISSFKSADKIMKPGAAFYIWHADSEGFNFRGASKDIGWLLKQCLIWQKSAFVMGRQDYQWQHEPCLYGWKEGAAHTWTGDRRQSTLLLFDKPTRSAEHPTMKPVALFLYQIKNNSRPGDCIVDFFAGSGTTLIASHKIKRRSRLMEIDPLYCDVILNRWMNFTRIDPIREDGTSWKEICGN